MEKTTSRPRRNGDDPDVNQLKSRPAQSAERGDIPAAVTGIDNRGQTVQRVKKRIQEAGAGGGGRAETLPALQDAFVDERNDVLAVINELEDQLDRDQEIRESLERELTGTAERLQAANTRVQELEWQVVTLQTRVEALEQERQQAVQLEEALSDANARAHRVKEQLALAEKERAQLKNELKAVNKQLDELWSIRKERDSLRADYRSLSLKVEELERNQREVFEERGQLQLDLQRMRAALAEVTVERNQLQMALRNTEERTREFAQLQESLSEKIDALRAERKNLQAQMAHLERENARLVEQRQFYECEVTSLRNQNRTAEAALTSVKKAFSEVRMALTDTKARTRRRSLDNWPRIGSILHGITPGDRDDAVAPPSAGITSFGADLSAGEASGEIPVAVESTPASDMQD